MTAGQQCDLHALDDRQLAEDCLADFGGHARGPVFSRRGGHGFDLAGAHRGRFLPSMLARIT